MCEAGSEKAPVIVQTNSIAMTKFHFGWNEFWVEKKRRFSGYSLPNAHAFIRQNSD